MRCDLWRDRIVGFAWYEVRGVLAGAYRGRQNERATVTHVLAVGEAHEDYRTLCSRVDTERLVDGCGGEALGVAPTCAICVARLKQTDLAPVPEKHRAKGGGT